MNTRIAARFDIERRRQLRQLFSPKRLCTLWRQLVRDQMRSFDIRDLHDYYDFNFAIEARASAIVERVLSGYYRADPPLIYKLEKKHGVCRHMMIPTPSDVLVFQLLTDALYPALTKCAPSKRAYYARDRHGIKLPHEHKEAISYPWFVLWPRFQRDIWNFSRSYKYLVTTDLANYFDCIGLRELRHVISSLVRTKEVYLDLLFCLIEDLSWKPDYLPPSHKGLPTISIEAPRLLAHALLFEVDAVLKKRARNDFVRWMDDINFGIDDPQTAKGILGDINDVLKSRGLSLNLSKTVIMTSSEAEGHFLFTENVRLTALQDEAKRIAGTAAGKQMASKVKRQLLKHQRGCVAKNKDKLTKRYLTILRILGDPCAAAEAERIYLDDPGLRASALKYLTSLPFDASIAQVMVRLLDGMGNYDDATRFGYVTALVEWRIPRSREACLFIERVRKRLGKTNSAFDWICLLWFLGKYGKPHDVMNAVLAGKRNWNEPFVARQRVAVLSRCLGLNHDYVIRLWQEETITGYPDSASVANNLLKLLSEGFSEQGIKKLPVFVSDARSGPLSHRKISDPVRCSVK